MARVNKDEMARTLDGLVAVGVLQSWTARPLGMYWLFMPDGTRLTPDTKETAMWVMGASATMLAHAEGRVAQDMQSPEPDFAPEFVGEFLDTLVQINAIQVWEFDADGDYIMRAGDETIWFSPDRIGPFMSGAVVVLQAKAGREEELANAKLVADRIRQQLDLDE
jgi:hypothetical protein